MRHLPFQRGDLLEEVFFFAIQLRGPRVKFAV
jgi:hypothetical protein